MNPFALLKLPGRLAKPPAVGQTPSSEVFRENKWRLLRYHTRAEGLAFRTPVLLVPSLINRHYVLDLLPHKSFAADSVARGHDVYIIDWGTPGAEDRYLGFDDFADRYLGRAVRRVAALSRVPKIHLFGYCLGGTLSVIQAALNPEPLASLLALGAPVKFQDDGMLAAFCRAPGLDVPKVMAGLGNLPWPLMQLAFHALRPTLTLAKAMSFLGKADDDAFVEGFLALETWGNDNVSFPGRCFEEYVERLYRKDALINGELYVSARRVDLRRITCPTLAVTFEHDNIVPWKSASVLLDRVGGPAEHLHVPGGHVGALVSSHGKKMLWPQLSEFWAKHEVERPRANRRGDAEVRA